MCDRSVCEIAVFQDRLDKKRVPASCVKLMITGLQTFEIHRRRIGKMKRIHISCDHSCKSLSAVYN
jgi:hypothetical protein